MREKEDQGESTIVKNVEGSLRQSKYCGNDRWTLARDVAYDSTTAGRDDDGQDLRRHYTGSFKMRVRSARRWSFDLRRFELGMTRSRDRHLKQWIFTCIIQNQNIVSKSLYEQTFWPELTVSYPIWHYKRTNKKSAYNEANINKSILNIYNHNGCDTTNWISPQWRNHSALFNRATSRSRVVLRCAIHIWNSLLPSLVIVEYPPWHCNLVRALQPLLYVLCNHSCSKEGKGKLSYTNGFLLNRHSLNP